VNWSPTPIIRKAIVTIAIDRIDHLVLTVFDLERTIEFYARVLGMAPVTFAGGRRGLAFGRQKLNLHQAGAEFEPRALKPAPGAIDLCFISTTPLEQVKAELEAHGIVVIQGPVAKTGALGPMMSVYFRDPDGNLIEVCVYDNVHEP
jgi:catechol 2,3-dioxygenase-like lactoylglutathione lyase family enzyme